MKADEGASKISSNFKNKLFSPLDFLFVPQKFWVNIFKTEFPIKF